MRKHTALSIGGTRTGREGRRWNAAMMATTEGFVSSASSVMAGGVWNAAGNRTLSRTAAGSNWANRLPRGCLRNYGSGSAGDNGTYMPTTGYRLLFDPI